MCWETTDVAGGGCIVQSFKIIHAVGAGFIDCISQQHTWLIHRDYTTKQLNVYCS
jgi:hypothetical protein